jgi:hypothetical protein
MRAVPFGNSDGDILSGADFTGDGRDELVFAIGPRSITYYIGDAVTGDVVLSRQWGSNVSSDYALPPADYTGDGKADIVAVRNNISPMVWYILDSMTNTATATQFGVGRPTGGNSADFPIQGDYDGDGRQDIAVWRPNGTFYVLRSSDGGLTAQTWGEAGDLPLVIPKIISFRID